MLFGGTEATALFPMVVETLRKSGFEVTKFQQNNPVYSIKYTDNEHPVIGFSKKLDDDFNPKSEFAAIMTCDSANEACPFVSGAEKRIPITFEDPKAFDNTHSTGRKIHGKKSANCNRIILRFLSNKLIKNGSKKIKFS